MDPTPNQLEILRAMSEALRQLRHALGSQPPGSRPPGPRDPQWAEAAAAVVTVCNSTGDFVTDLLNKGVPEDLLAESIDLLAEVRGYLGTFDIATGQLLPAAADALGLDV